MHLVTSQRVIRQLIELKHRVTLCSEVQHNLAIKQDKYRRVIGTVDFYETGRADIGVGAYQQVIFPGSGYGGGRDR